MSDALLNTHQTAEEAGCPDVESGSSEAQAPPAGQSQERKFRFGARVLQEAYDILSIGARLLDLACLFRTELTPDGCTTVVVCETWHLTKEVDSPRIEVHVRDFTASGERPLCRGWVPAFPLLPATPKRAAWRGVLGRALQSFADTFEQEAAQDRDVLRQARQHEHFPLMRDAFVSAKLAQLERRLGAERINSLSETLSKIIWKHVIDPEFVRVVAYARMLRPVTLQHYCEMAEHWKVLARAYEQDRYMLPLCQIVRFDEYEQATPFSVARWTKEGVHMSRDGPVRLSSPAAYRALVAMHPAIVRAWAEISWRRGTFATLFALLADVRQEGPIPQPVLWSLVGALGGASVCWTFEQPILLRLVRVVRQYVRECRRRRALPEFRTYRRAVQSLDLRSVLDWCVNGGRRARELDKHATWSGIERRSRLWHGRIWQAPHKQADLSWSSALGPCEISGVRVIPLTTSRALWEEGRAMQHCVVTYATKCAMGGYRLFALVGEMERATLGIIEVAGRWRVDQARVAANGSVSEYMKAVAGTVARAYRGGMAALAQGGAVPRPRRKRGRQEPSA